MGLSEILSNPLFVPLLVAVITIIFNAVFLYWLRTWQYTTEYIIRNVEKTYIPLTAEIHDRLEQFDRFLSNPNGLHYAFETLERIRKSGLFEFIRNHDKKLFDSLEFFYNKIYPKLEELNKVQRNVRNAILRAWVRHIENTAQNETTKTYANNFINNLFESQIFVSMLNERTEEILEKWNKNRTNFSKRHKDFKVAKNEIDTLLEIAQPKIKEILDFYNKLKIQLDKHVINALIPRMQKYISNPLSR